MMVNNHKLMEVIRFQLLIEMYSKLTLYECMSFGPCADRPSSCPLVATVRRAGMV